MQRRRNPFIKIFFIRSWWVILFFLFSFISYEQSIRSKNKNIFDHTKKLSALEIEKQKSIKENDDLDLIVNSLSDPAWIEMILMRDLGVVPEGKLKVHFTNEENSK